MPLQRVNYSYLQSQIDSLTEMVAFNLTQMFASPDYWLASLKVKGAREKVCEGLQKYLYMMYNISIIIYTYVEMITKGLDN